jgi:hypothetical protein
LKIANGNHQRQAGVVASDALGSNEVTAAQGDSRKGEHSNGHECQQYQQTDGNDERKAILERLDERLTRLSSTSQLERAANEAENLNKAIKYNPLGFWVY